MRPRRSATPSIVSLLLALLTVAAMAEQAPAGLRVIVANDDETAGALVVAFTGSAPQPVETVAGVVGYALLQPGLHRVALERAPDADEPHRRAALATVEVELEGGAYYTLIVSFPTVVESDAPAWHTQEVETALLRDEFDALPPAGHTSLRVAHAEPLTGAFRIEVRPYDPAAPLGDDDGEPDDPPEEGDDAEDHTMRFVIEPLQQSERLDLRSGLYHVTASRTDGVWRSERLRYDLQAGVAYSLYLMVVAPDVVSARLVIDAAMPAPPYRERR
jgi:hypothetical protein